MAPRKMSMEYLNKKLSEATKQLLQPLTSLHKLLPLLTNVGNTLATVDRSPAKSTHVSLSGITEALVTDELIWHSEVDVQVAVAYCLIQITRITEPDYPFDDEKMKDVFRLIVSTFDNLSDRSSKSYIKRVLILETLARVNFCILMVDFKCDDLITEMFQIFFRTVRDYHADVTILSMKKIMVRILKESDDISSKLLTTLLSSMENDNEQFSPVARRLGEMVFLSCAVELKTHVRQAIKSMKSSLDNYSEIVYSVCGGTIEQQTNNVSAEQLGAKDVEGTYLDNIVVSESSPKRDRHSHEKARLVEKQVPSECQESSGKRKVSGMENDRKNPCCPDDIWLSNDPQLHEGVEISYDPSWKKHKTISEADEADPTSTVTSSIMRDVDVHAEDSSVVGSVGKGECGKISSKQIHSSALLLGQQDEFKEGLLNTPINMEKFQSTLERMQSFSRARLNQSMVPSHSEDTTNSPSPRMLPKQLWKDFMTYPLKVFGNPENEIATANALSVLIENSSLHGEEAKLLVELEEILTSILRERSNKTRLQDNSRQLLIELKECANAFNKLLESVGTKKMEYDDLEMHEKVLVMQELELERRMQEVRAKKKIIGTKRRIKGEKMEEESVKAEETMSMAEEKEARNRRIKEEEANADSEIDNLMSRFFSLRSQFNRPPFN